MTESLQGTVRDLSRFGEGVVTTDRGQVFAPGTLPGELVTLRRVRRRGKVLRADSARVVEPSDQRVEPACPFVDRCGGCPLMIAAPALQAAFKQGLLDQALAHLPNAGGVRRVWVPAQSGLGYRRRARLGWARLPSGPLIGYRPPRSRRVADVQACAVLHPVLERGYQAFRAECGEALSGHGELHLAMGRADRPVVAVRSDDPQPPALYAALERLVTGGRLAGAALRAGGASADATWGEPRELRLGADGRRLWGTVAGFSQANDEINRALVKHVLELARPEGRDVLELFSGAGNLTVALAPLARTLVAIEQDEEAASACRENLRDRGLNATVRTDDAEVFRAPRRPDVAVIDPPRIGAPGAIRSLAQLRVPEIVYVSCDPPTLGRDLGALSRAGYVVTDAIGLDMFPQTAHLEVVVRLALRE